MDIETVNDQEFRQCRDLTDDEWICIAENIYDVKFPLCEEEWGVEHYMTYESCRKHAGNLGLLIVAALSRNDASQEEVFQHATGWPDMDADEFMFDVDNRDMRENMQGSVCEDRI